MRILSLSTIIQQSMFSTHLNSIEPSMKCAGHVNHKNRVNASISKDMFVTAMAHKNSSIKPVLLSSKKANFQEKHFLSFLINSKSFYLTILSIIMMTTVNEQEMSESLCGKCKNYLFVPEDKYGTWCIYYKDISKAIREEKITLDCMSDPTDRSIRYDLYGLVYCKGFEPK